MPRIIFHIDVNSAFLSWTSAENLRTGAGPDLRTIPAVIAGDQASRRRLTAFTPASPLPRPNGSAAISSWLRLTGNSIPGAAMS